MVFTSDRRLRETLEAVLGAARRAMFGKRTVVVVELRILSSIEGLDV